MSYFVKEYDFLEAIRPDVRHKMIMNPETGEFVELNIIEVTTITDAMSKVATTHGTYICESFGSANDDIYMRVTKFIER